MDTERTCTKCGQAKPIEDFAKYGGRRVGYQQVCKECKNAYLRAYMAANPDQRRKKRERKWEWRAVPENRAYENAQQYQRYRDDPARRALTYRRHQLKKQYGITLDDYDRMVEEQGGGCAICGGPPSGKHQYFHIDHDHIHGNVRGLLCAGCNTAIGLLRDDPAIIKAALAYVRKHHRE